MAGSSLAVVLFSNIMRLVSFDVSKSSKYGKE